ncbi:MAG: hypothetical protein U9R11_00955 [Chloroflexota bacterium]|nr:hypothetical protein [Chloroflexota bacterium]
MAVSGKTVGLILIVIGIVIGLGWGGYMASGPLTGGANVSAAILGSVLVLAVVVLPFVGVGTFLFVRGSQEAAAMAELARERKVLDMVQAHGQVRVAKVALELDATRDQVKDYIYDLVGKGLFTGYINWDEGVLYSKQASELRTNKCPHCGGELELAGKGVVRCPYCGTEIFL